jgi:hypothetical protein
MIARREREEVSTGSREWEEDVDKRERKIDRKKER